MPWHVTFLFWHLSSDGVGFNAELRIHLRLECAQTSEDARLTLVSDALNTTTFTTARDASMLACFFRRHLGLVIEARKDG